MNIAKYARALLPVFALVLGCSAESTGDDDTAFAEQLTGNGGPSGPHYNLNIIGVPQGKTASMTGNNGSRIFVPLYGQTKILLSPGSTFQVLDANGTDSDGASFLLPAPDPDNDGITEYSVFARALGKPGGNSSTRACITDPEDPSYLLCSVYSMDLRSTKGPSKFTNVSNELLYVYADIDGDGDIERVPLFGDDSMDFLWEYDNNGLKLAQLRFYDVSTNVN